MITVGFILSHVSVVVGNMSGKPLMNSVYDGTITKAMTAKMPEMKHVCKNICLSILNFSFSLYSLLSHDN